MNALLKILDPHERFTAARNATLIDRYWWAFDHFRQRWETIAEIVYQRMFHRQAEAVMKVLETYEMFSGAGFDETQHPRGKTTPQSTPGSFAPSDQKAAPVAPSHEINNLTTEEGYVYHATNLNNAYDIAESSLLTHGPSYGTDQSEWPDGSREKRSYFSRNASVISSFAPEHGNPVALRIKDGAHFKTEAYTHDVYTNKKIPARSIEYWGADGNWHPLTDLNRSATGAGFEESEHPRGKTTQPSTPGSFAPKDYVPSVTIGMATDRAYNGKTEPTETKVSKSKVGRLSEDIIIAYLRSHGLSADPLNLQRNNYPIDIMQGNNMIEVKGGLVSNGPSALHWRMTIGEPGPTEKALIAKMGKSEKQEHNRLKQKLIMQRKVSMVRTYSRRLGHQMEGRTMTLILNPDKGLADIYSFKGFHQRIGWKAKQVKDAYVTTVSYKVNQ